MVDLLLSVDTEIEGKRLVEVELRSRVEPDDLVSGNGELDDLGDRAAGIGSCREYSCDGRVRDVFRIEVRRLDGPIVPETTGGCARMSLQLLVPEDPPVEGRCQD